jgi:hypothetical protein
MMQALHAVLVLGQTDPLLFAPNFRPGANSQMAQLRSDLLGAATFSKIVPPESNRCASGSCYSGSGTDVDFQIRFVKVHTVAAAEGSMRLKVWLRMYWDDTRLSWNESAYGGISTVYFSGTSFAGAEDNEIWIPDLQPYNAFNGIVNTLDPAHMRVSSSGRVFYSRPGTIDVMCKFSGLVAFPFDKLKCPLEVGGWVFSGGQQGVNLLDGGYEFSNQEVSSGTSYQEYELESLNATLKLYTYACCASEPWPIVIYDITLSRATDFYLVVCIVPGILLTMLSFVVFWTPTSSADSLGYGISVVVVNVLSNIVIMDMLPVCGEMIWIDLFSFVNTAFCCISLLQSAVCIMLENNTDTHFLPIWLTYGLKELGRLIQVCAMRCCGKEPPREEETSKEELAVLSSSAAVTESVAGVLYRQSRARAGTAPPPQADTMSEAQKVERLVFYESLFFLLDQDSSMYIDREECDALLSFTALSIDPLRRDEIMSTHDCTNDGKLSRSEFCMMCVENMWDVPMPVMERAVQNLQKAKLSKKNRNQVYWSAVSDRVDSFARLGVPSLYFLALIAIFHIDLRDEYDKAGSVRMFSGVNHLSSLSARGTAFICGYLVIALFCGVLWALARSAAQRADNRKKRQFFTNTRNASQSLSASSNGLMTKWEERIQASDRYSADVEASSPDRQEATGSGPAPGACGYPAPALPAKKGAGTVKWGGSRDRISPE